MNQNEFDNKERFTVKELSELFDRSVVRVWKVINDGRVPCWSRMVDGQRRDILVSKDALPILMNIFQTESVSLERRGRPRGQKNKPGHKAGRPPGSKNKEEQVTA